MELEKVYKNRQCISLVATVDRRGSCKDYVKDKKAKRLLTNLVNVYGVEVTDHCWIDNDKIKGHRKGDVIRVICTAQKYYKKGGNIDYTINILSVF